MTKSESDHDQSQNADGSQSRSNQSKQRHDRVEQRLWESVRAGDQDPIEKLANRYSRIAVFMANAHQGRGLDYDHLLDQAKQAVRSAVTKYDPQRSDDFSVFAIPVVRNHLTTEIRQNSDLSAHERQQHAKFEQAKTRRRQDLEREPTDEDVYEFLGWSPAVQQHHQSAKKKTNAKRVEPYKERTGHYPTDPRVKVPSEVFGANVSAEILHAEIKKLDTVSREVIVQRFLDPDEPSRDEIALRSGVTESRVRTVEAKALDTLRTRLQGTEAAP